MLVSNRQGFDSTRYQVPQDYVLQYIVAAAIERVHTTELCPCLCTLYKYSRISNKVVVRLHRSLGRRVLQVAAFKRRPVGLTMTKDQWPVHSLCVSPFKIHQGAVPLVQIGCSVPERRQLLGKQLIPVD
jgi:hypothetical protein